MLISQNFLTALRGLMANKLRSALTILGIVIGVAAVVALMAIGNGATSSITDSITSNGSNLLNIQAGRSQRPTAGVPFNQSYLTYNDYLALSKTLTDTAGIAPAYQSNATITAGVNTSTTSVTGVTEDYIKVHTYTLATGRGLTTNDRTKRSQVAVIGATTAETLFPNGSALGQSIKINNTSYTVVGVLASKGSTGFDNTDDVVLIPLETGYLKLFGSNAIRNGEKIVSAIAISASSAASVDSVSSGMSTTSSVFSKPVEPLDLSTPTTV